ncbi:MAG TPA: hypothetical protein VGR37_23795 [Longimicrobiaceae bacterium]|nr:hypothetical protein [Longimicrobiaceae bacterium]
MLRPTATALLLVLAAGCTPGAPASAPVSPAPAPPPAASPAPVPDPYRPCWNRPDTEACVARTEQRLLAATAGRVRREGDRLLFQGTGRANLPLEDDRTEGARTVLHRYAGWIPEIGHHLVQLSFYEGGGWLLVDGETTNQVQVLGPPVVAPDRSRFAATSVDLEAGYDPNGIQVWSMAQGFPRLEWGVDGGSTWGASDAAWIDANTVEFTRHVNTTGDPEQTRTIRTRLVLGEDGITLRSVGR